MRTSDPMWGLTNDIRVTRTHGGHLLSMPLPKYARIANEFLAGADWIHRSGYLITFHAVNVRAVYRLETLEQGVWIAKLIEWGQVGWGQVGWGQM